MKIGFCCKLVKPNTTKLFENIAECNTKTTTAKWLLENKSAADDKLISIVKHNVQSIYNIVKVVASYPPHQRMVRLSSEILPLYTHSDFCYFYDDSVMNLVERELAKVGKLAKETGVRLSFHPGQFVVVASENPNVVENSIAELEYHAKLATMMGYGVEKLDFKINIHLSGKRGTKGFLEAWDRFSPAVKNCLTLENDEFQAGLDDILPLSDKVGIVLDVHHHFIRTGEYIRSNDSRIQRVKDSWQNRRPVIHYSQTPEEYLDQFKHLPSLEELVKIAPKTKLRMHSTFYNHQPTNQWAIQHLEWADMQCEAKGKNLSSEQISTLVFKG